MGPNKGNISGKGGRCRLVLAALLAAAALFGATFPAMARPGDKILNRPYADQKRLHLGFSIGMSLQDLKFTHNGYETPDGQQWFAEVPAWAPGINVDSHPACRSAARTSISSTHAPEPKPHKT